jgi:damage-control phosphatase, subfamily I
MIMKVHYECASCFLRQAREALDLATEDIELKMKITEQINQILCNEFRKGAVANEIGTKIHRTIKMQTGNQDPYHVQREKSDQIALQLLPQVEEILKKNGNLESYLKASIAGNLLDFGALGLSFNIEGMIMPTLEKVLSINNSYELEQELKMAENVLYLADNVGEIVFDKLLIRKLLEYGVEVTIALKEEPILNDACMKEALEVGLDEVAHLTTIGTDSVGVIYHNLSEEFKQKFKEADVIIAKGLGNYEGLDEMQIGDKPIFCLLNAKCEPIARDIGVNKGDNVVLMLNPAD